MLPGDANVVMALPLVQSRLPVAPSYACSMAGVPLPPAEGRPVASVNTTPFTVIGVAGAERLWDTHPGCNDSEPAASLNFNAITDPAATAPLVAVTPLATGPL